MSTLSCSLIALCCFALSAKGADMISFDAGSLRLGLDAKGQVVSLFDVVDNKECLPKGKQCALLRVIVRGKQSRLASLAYDEAKQRLDLDYSNGVRAAVDVAVKPTHVTFELASVAGAKPAMIHWGAFPTTIGKTVGGTVGVARDERFAIGIQGLNIQTVAGAARKNYGSLLYAYAREKDGGVLGSKIALFGCPADKALETIGQIELAEGLPHPMLDGVWGKVSPTARRPYLIVAFNEANFDEVLDIADKGGFKYVYHPGPFRTWGHFELRPEWFPDGDESLKRCVDKAAKRGIRVGLHTLTSFITTNDPYVTPVPDARLARTGSSALAAAVDDKAVEIAVADRKPFAASGGLAAAIIGQEIVQYERVTDAAPFKLVGCKRGAFGTRAAAHAAGADIGRLASHAYKTFYPGIDNGMMDEMTERLVQLFNYTGLRQMSFDGLEGLWSYGHGQWAACKFVKQCFDGWDHEVITDASCPTHYNWHVHTRFNWGELTQSAKTDVDVYRSKNCDYFRDNFLPAAMGWWRFGLASCDWEATRPEDVEYLLAKAAGNDATHALVTDPSTVKKHGYADTYLARAKAWDQARQASAFSPEQVAKLREKGRDFHLETVGEKQWKLFEVKYSPFHWTCPGTGRAKPLDPKQCVLSFTTESEEHLGDKCRVTNPFAPQPLRFELRTLGSFDYDLTDNIDLTPSPGEFKWEPDLHKDAPRIAVADATVAGLKGYEVSTKYDGKDKSSWVTRVIARLPKPLNLRQHRGLGLWVRGDGQGELLFVELVARNCKRQYYVPIDFTGERYFEFPLGEMCLGRYYDYDWNHWSGFASWWVTMKGFDYGHVDRITTGFNVIPPGAEVRCAVGGVKALKELSAGLHKPKLSLGEQSMAFDATLEPGEYLIYDGGAKAEVRDSSYRLLRGAPVAGAHIDAPAGRSELRVSYDGERGPAPWSRWEFKCLSEPEAVRAR